MNEAQREMTLEEVVGRLYEHHLARREYEELKAERDHYKKAYEAKAEYYFCAYCGKVYESTPVSELQAHVEVCPKHPLAKAQAELQARHNELLELAEGVASDNDAGRGVNPQTVVEDARRSHVQVIGAARLPPVQDIW